MSQQQETINLWDMAHYSGSLPVNGIVAVGQASAPIALDHTEAFDVTEIDRMIAESERDAFPYTWTDLPNIAPPFQKFFMFAKAGGTYIVNGQRHNHPSGWKGALFVSHKVPKGWGIEVFLCGGKDACVWQEESLVLAVANDGRMAQLEGRQRGEFGLVIRSERRKKELAGSGLSGQDIITAITGAVYPFFLAISIMHCKNVTAARVARSPKFAEVRRKKGTPIYSYGVLNIKPVAKLAESVGVSGNGAGVLKALHLCRGHFKDYREGAGLFGKTRGMFWWDASVRGSVESGVRVKDYRITSE